MCNLPAFSAVPQLTVLSRTNPADTNKFFLIIFKCGKSVELRSLLLRSLCEEFILECVSYMCSWYLTMSGLSLEVTDGYEESAEIIFKLE